MKGVYKYIHKIHHNFPAPIGMASEYAHPVRCVLGASATPPARSAMAHTQIEFFVGNSLPILVGPLLTGAHCQLLWFWIMIAISATCNGSRRWCSRVANSVLTGGSCAGHSGYLLPFSPFHDARNHDYHHSRFKVCAFVTVCVCMCTWVCASQLPVAVQLWRHWAPRLAARDKCRVQRVHGAGKGQGSCSTQSRPC